MSGAFEVGRDPTDLLIIGTRVYVATRAGVEIRELSDNQLVTVVPDAAAASRLVQVGDVVYAVMPRGIDVIDTRTARSLNRLDVRDAGDPVVRAGLKQVLIPARKQVAVVATEYHAVVRSRPFDEEVGSLVLSESGVRALALTGRMQGGGISFDYYGYIHGRPRRASGTAVYSFDPGRQESQQDSIRLEAGQHPWSAVFTSEDRAQVALRGENAVVEILWRADGSVSLGGKQSTCTTPDRLIRVARSDLVLVKCAGEPLVMALGPRASAPRFEFPGEIQDVVVSPDGAALYVAHEREGGGGLSAVNLLAGTVQRAESTAAPKALALSHDGRRLYALIEQRVEVFE